MLNHPVSVNNNTPRRKLVKTNRALWLISVTAVVFFIFFSSVQDVSEELSIYSQRALLTHNDEEKPIMYTFYTSTHKSGVVNEASTGDEKLLEVWKQKWTEAGWDARVISLADAETHPRYEEYSEKLARVPMRPTDLYNRYCFYRWLAMAAVGGGWMSDMDVLPLKHHKPDEYYKDGRFAIYSKAPRGGIPCLMSGSSSEWERLAFATVQNGIEHITNTHYGSWTDMFASVDLYISDPDTYELYDLMGAVEKVEWNEQTCREYDQKLALHFSHYSVQHVMDLEDINQRAAFASDYIDEWKKSCEEFEKHEDEEGEENEEGEEGDGDEEETEEQVEDEDEEEEPELVSLSTN